MSPGSVKKMIDEDSVSIVSADSLTLDDVDHRILSSSPNVDKVKEQIIS